MDFGLLGSTRRAFGELNFWTKRTLELAGVRCCLLCKRIVVPHRTYALQIVQLYSMNSTANVHQKYLMYTTFWNTLRLIPRCTRQPLDRYVIVPKVHPSDQTSPAFWPYKYPITPHPFHTILAPHPPSSPLGYQ